MLTVPVKLAAVDLAALHLCAVHADHFGGHHIRSMLHGAARNEYRRHIHAGDGLQTSRDRLIAACRKDSRVERRCFALDLKHVGDKISGCERVVHTVGTLNLSVAKVTDKVFRAACAMRANRGAGIVRDHFQMYAAGTALSVGACHKDLRQSQFFHFPTGP